jgi:hypothetical protein
MADDLDAFLDRAYLFLPALTYYGIELSDEDWSDPDIVRNALLELKERNAGQGFSRVEHGQYGPPQVSGHRTARGRLQTQTPYAEETMSRLNPRGNRRRRRNPADESMRSRVEEYLRAPAGERSFDPQETGRLRQQQAGFMDQSLTPSVVSTLFPHTGNRDAWRPERRIPEAIGQFDLLARRGKARRPEPALVDALMEGSSPYASQEAIDYLVESAGLSLDEAQDILEEMQGSVGGRKSKSGMSIAMQPSSAICKMSSVRRLPYRPPKSLFERVGDRAVVILISPPDQSPRVMSWRRGSHIDCDMVANYAEDTYGLLSRALQSAILWVSEKRGRGGSSIYVGTVGEGAVYQVWNPSSGVLSLDALKRNFSASLSTPIVYEASDAARERDEQAYIKALQKISKPFTPLSDRKRKPRGSRRRQAPRLLDTELPPPIDEIPGLPRTINKARDEAIRQGADPKRVRAISRDTGLSKQDRIRQIMALPAVPQAVSAPFADVEVEVEVEEEEEMPVTSPVMDILTAGRAPTRRPGSPAKENTDTSSASYWFGKLLGTSGTGGSSR